MVDWLNLSQSSGSGYQLVSVTALPNLGIDRSTSFIVSGNTIVRNIEVEQESYDIVITPFTYTFDCTGGTQAFSVFSKSDWSVSSYPNWLSLDVLSGSSGTTVITATAGSNDTQTKLSSSIVVTNQTSSASTDVYQDRNELNSYLTFTITSPGVIYWKYVTDLGDTELPRTIYYNKNNTSWTSITSSTSGSSFNVTTGDVIWFKGDYATYAEDKHSTGIYVYNTFRSTASFDLSGNIMSLVNSTNFSAMTNFWYDAVFYCLFYECKALKNAGELMLPATTLATNCYAHMFEECTSLKTAPRVLPATTLKTNCYYCMFSGCTALSITPELPATTLATSCYEKMFDYCTSLTTAPRVLPATALTNNCYRYMFYRCSSLTTAPELPATTLAASAYAYMFYGCSSLEQAPALPATTLADSCYGAMFAGCTRLTTAPELPATTLAVGCYGSMFYNCRSLTTAPALPATTLAGGCYVYMFAGCTRLTTAPVLPATTLAVGCYNQMFLGCTSLTTAPELPATTSPEMCYYYMFSGCTSLTTAPELPATTLGWGCYYGMFEKCTSLTTAQRVLPATTLVNYCYAEMFQDCTRLTTAPELPATTLAAFCYGNMFENCTSLTRAPELPAETLVTWCYDRMFKGCSKLNYVKVLGKRIGYSAQEWLEGVSSTGTLVCTRDGDWYKPASGWTIQYID